MRASRLLVPVAAIMLALLAHASAATLHAIPGGGSVPGFHPVIVYTGANATRAEATISVVISASCEGGVAPPTPPSVNPVTIVLPVLPVSINGSLVYATLVPGLPALKLGFSMPRPTIPPSSAKCTLSVGYRVRVRVYNATGEVGEVVLRVEPLAKRVNLPPLVLVGVEDAGWLGSSPGGFAAPGGRQVRVHILALDDDAEPSPELEVVNSSGVYRIQPIIDPGFREALEKLRDWLNKLTSSITAWLGSVTGGKAPTLPKPVMGVYMGYAVVSGEPGSYAEYRAVISEGGSVYASLPGIVYFYNASAGITALVVDDRVPLYLLYRLAEEGWEKLNKSMGAWGLPRDAINKLIEYLKPVFIEAGVARPHWEIVGRYAKLYITPPGPTLCKLLDELKPRVVILGFTPLGLKTASGVEPLDQLLNGDLSSIKCGGETLLEKLLEYVRRSRAGLIATMGSLNGYEVAVCDEKSGNVTWIEVGPVGHLGRSLEDINPVAPRALAPALGLPMLTLLEAVKRTITEQFCKLAHRLLAAGDARYAEQLATISTVLGSAPLAAYAPFSSGINFAWGVFSKLGYVGFSAKAPGAARYTLVGWQLEEPYTVYNTSWAALKRAVGEARGAMLALRGVLVNATRIASRLFHARLDPMLATRGYNYSIETLLPMLHRALAYANYTESGTLHLRLDLGLYNMSLSFDLGLYTALKSLLAYPPPIVAGVSRDGLGAVLLYDVSWRRDGYRAALVTFEPELAEGPGAEGFWRLLLDWVSSWRYKPSLYANLSGLVAPRSLVDAFKSLVENVAKGARRIGNQTLLVPEHGYAKLRLRLRQGTRLIVAVLHPDSEKINATLLRGNARIVEIIHGNRTTIIIVTGGGNVTLGLRADPDASITRAYVEEYEAPSTATTTTTATQTQTTTTPPKTVTTTTTVTTTVTRTVTIPSTVTRTTTVTVTATTTVTARPVTVTTTSTVEKTVTRTYTTTVTLPGTTITMRVTATSTTTKTLKKTRTSTTTITTTVTRSRPAPGSTTIAAIALVAGLAIGYVIARIARRG